MSKSFSVSRIASQRWPSVSTKSAHLAPLLRASIPRLPVPAYASRTLFPSKSAPSMEKIARRTFSDVGLRPDPFPALILRPLCFPPDTRTFIKSSVYQYPPNCVCPHGRPASLLGVYSSNGDGFPKAVFDIVYDKFKNIPNRETFANHAILSRIIQCLVDRSFTGSWL